MQHSNEFEDAMASIYMSDTFDPAETVPIFLPSNLSPEMREIIAEVVRTSPDMRISNPDAPWEGGDIVQEPRIATVQQKSLAEMPEKAALSQALTRQQIMAKRQKAVREANSECWSALRAQGFKSQQHTENDFVQVIVRLLDLQLDGVTQSISALLKGVFPDAPEKAKSIRGSNRAERWKAAYSSDVVRNHPVEIAMRAIYGRVGMNQRASAVSFGASLSIHVALFKGCDRIAKLEARLQLPEQQMQATKQREALADTGALTPKEMVLTLYKKELGPTVIAKQLGMNLERVRSIIARSKRT
ncbi:sigma-70 family RNA polymerase sigma factor [Dechloromonas denitrificans]|uniref:hypothetical protein n=1 Tax=Dechloromonas denitrificans TaxID=281362 RepID=UPI001CF8DF69|nr:hypothetical protein [Dechloromonas denitrificans]UCV12287.1 sigma-70 family RNA polymerase sigma factor [Dechloromonas denitrificans]